ncbi:MAG: group II intron reverse transcriptase/maturase, partial [Oscillospiraceae bacterium]|nr:group II intron reverse transcriptase/maturase [Oscillospiraceae bacterium]
SRSQGRNVRKVMENVKVYIRGWLGYFGIASMKTTMQRWDEWLRRRLRVYIWKQWKVPSARIRNLMKLGIPKYYANKWGYIKAYWNVAGSPVLQRSITNERLAQAGYYSILARYESLHLCD